MSSLQPHVEAGQHLLSLELRLLGKRNLSLQGAPVAGTDTGRGLWLPGSALCGLVCTETGGFSPGADAICMCRARCSAGWGRAWS